MKECRFSYSLNIECFMSAFEANYSPDFNFTGEYHDFWEAVYIISSKAGVSADDKIYSLSKGDIIFHKPMEFHRIWAIEGLPVNAFIFSFRLSGNLSARLKNKVIRLSPEQNEAMTAIIEEFCGLEKENSQSSPERITNFLRSWKQDSVFNMAVKCRTELFFLDIIRSEISQKEQYSSKSADIYRKIITIMKENVYESLTVADIARKCSFSESYIKKIFSEFSDSGIHTYFIRLKIKESVLLLKSGLSVGETSERLSFSNANYFTVCFKKEMGESPTKYLKFRR